MAIDFTIDYQKISKINQVSFSNGWLDERGVLNQ